MTAMQIAFSLNDQSQVGEARRRVAYLAQDAGFDETDCGRAAIVVTELSTNLVRYAKEGQILIRAGADGDRKLIEIHSIDRGPGIADVARSLTDGYSTGGTPGNGLGAIERICDVFDIYSSVPQGTVIYTRIDSKSATTPPSCAFVCGVINRPAPYEEVSGDTWRIAERSGVFSLIMIDGLGHGPEAAAAANTGADVFDEDPFATLTTTFDTVHRRMQGSRGGAVAALQIDAANQQMKFVGVGNIAGSIRTSAEGSGRGLFSHNGIVGLQIHRAQEFTYAFPDDSLLILHSDGLQTRWSLDKYPGLYFRHPSVIAGVLFRDFCRGRDDVTVAVIRRSMAGANGQ